MQKKIGGATFEYSEDMNGMVQITSGSQKVNVTWDALQDVVAERVRAKKIEQLENMKPAQLLGLK